MGGIGYGWAAIAFSGRAAAAWGRWSLGMAEGNGPRQRPGHSRFDQVDIREAEEGMAPGDFAIRREIGPVMPVRTKNWIDF